MSPDAAAAAAFEDRGVGIELESPAFGDGERIPSRHTCEGDDLSPALRWRGIPPAARELALVVDDPDAPRGTFVHWVAWSIAADATGVEEGERAAAEGRNGFGGVGYRGPCPPPGHGVHRYRFRLYALDSAPALGLGADATALRQAIEGHVLDTGLLVGTYSRGR